MVATLKNIEYIAIASKSRKYFIKILPGDTVTLEMSPYDLTRGRIVYRHK